MHNIGRFRIIRRPAFPVISEIYEGFYLGGFPAFVRFDTTLYCPTKLKTMKSGKQDGNSVKIQHTDNVFFSDNSQPIHQYCRRYM